MLAGLVLVIGAVAAVLLLALPSTSALAAGGKSIATATPVAYGQQEFGNTATDQFLEDSCGFGIDAWRSYWNLNVLAGDELTIDWEGSPGTELKLVAVGTTDFTFFQKEPVASQSLSSNGHSELKYKAPQTGVMPMYFRVCDFYESAAGPYDFMATDQHALVVGLQQYAHIKSTTTLWGTASLADGTPVPDGLVFTLTASWGTRGQAQYQAASGGGALSFPLTLPVSAQGRFVTFTITRAADTQYQEAKSAGLKVKVALPKKPVVHHHHHRRRHHHHRHHRRQSAHASADVGPEQQCLDAALARPELLHTITMHHAGLRPLTPHHWHSQGTSGWFQLPALPEGCAPAVVRAVAGQIQMQKRTDRRVWINVGAKNGNLNWKGPQFVNLYAGPNHAWPDYVFNECTGGKGWLKVRGVLNVKAKDGGSHDVLDERRYTFPAVVHGSCQLARTSKRETAHYKEEWGDEGSGTLGEWPKQSR